MKKRMIIWLVILLSLLIVARSGVYSLTVEPVAAAEPAALQVEPTTESPNEEPDLTLPDGNGNMVNLAALYWRNPDGDGNMVNLAALYWRNPDGDGNMVSLAEIYGRNMDRQENQRSDIGAVALD